MSVSAEAAEAPPRTASLLSRYAESLFWLARYMERIENRARILDVTENFSRNSIGPTPAGGPWLSVVQINSDEERFFRRHKQADATSVLDFYVTDADNATAITAEIGFARENARTLRPIISTEMWTQINIFHREVRAITAADLSPSRLSATCGMLKQGCQTHAGILEGTFFRDQGWMFYQIGKNLERADQITRLLDIKYHTLLPSVDAVGSPFDVSQWNALLRAASGYHAFRRVFPSGMSAATVAGFLLMNNAFPRSLVVCLRQLETHLQQLRTAYYLRAAAPALERLDGLRDAMVEQAIGDILFRGLHEFLDWVQQQLLLLGAEVATAFWHRAA